MKIEDGHRKTGLPQFSIDDKSVEMAEVIKKKFFFIFFLHIQKDNTSHCPPELHATGQGHAYLIFGTPGTALGQILLLAHCVRPGAASGPAMPLAACQCLLVAAGATRSQRRESESSK